MPNITGGTSPAPNDNLKSSAAGRSSKCSAIVKNGAKLNQILPTGSTTDSSTPKSDWILNRKPDDALSFDQVFGMFGIPMLFILVICLAWTSWLIFLALAPSKAANLLMKTTWYDNGKFWLFNDTNPQIVQAGAAGLALVNLCYLFVILRMLLWRTNFVTSVHHRFPQDVNKSSLTSSDSTYTRFRYLWKELTAFEGKNRKKWNVVLKLFDLVMQTAMLRQLLISGSPASLTYGFATFLAVNALSCVVNVLTDRFSALTEVVIDSIFDLFTAVLFPIVTLVYSYYNFDFDREVYFTYLEQLPPGSFEHLARLFADQSEIALFRVNFDSLRIDSVLDFAIRISTNLTFCYRFERTLGAIVWTRHQRLLEKQQTAPNLVPVSQNPVPKRTTVMFVAMSLAVLISSHKAIRDSTALCSPHKECVVYSHRWKTSDEHCPCLILIDVELAPKTYHEWVNPIDAYAKVQALAAAGTLMSLQVINRQLLAWPEELRECRDLKVIQMMYTSIQSIPPWTKELQSLEIIHIEGKYGSLNLLDLPDDLFSDLPRLKMVHFGLHEHIDHLPPLTGVPNLQSLSLAWIPQLQTLPSLDHVPNLSRLILSALPGMKMLPDMSSLDNLAEFVVVQPNQMCCNGFLGTCDLNQGSCQSEVTAHIPAATCLMDTMKPHIPFTPYSASAGTRKTFEKFAPLVCRPPSLDTWDALGFPTKATTEICDGKRFRQCFLSDNKTGICYNTRFQALSCLANDYYIQLRRAQIEKGVGFVCDPVEEKWLGCRE